MNDLEIKQTKEISDANQPLEMIETSKKKRAKQWKRLDETWEVT